MTATTGFVPSPIEVKVTVDGQCIATKTYQTTPIRIGRLLDNDLVLPFDQISRFHAELRYEQGQWVVVDLKSTNGLQTADGQTVRELSLRSGSQFKIGSCEVQITDRSDQKTSATKFSGGETTHALASRKVTSGSRRTVLAPKGPPGPSVSLEKSAHSLVPPKNQEATNTDIDGEEFGDQPVLNFDGATQFCQGYRGVEMMQHHSLQLTLVWFDQVLSVKEFAVGAPLRFVFNQNAFRLGRVGLKETLISHPGLPSDFKVTLQQPLRFALEERVIVYLRYIPPSLELPIVKDWVDPLLLNPAVTSAVVHGTVAVAVLLSPKSEHGPASVPEPQNHFAKIIVPPPPEPPPQPVVKEEPPPPPVEVKPEEPPPPVVKKEEPPPPPPQIKPTKVVVKEKTRPMALARREEVAPTPRPRVEVRKTDEDNAPTPQPVNVKTIGALAAFSQLKTTASSNLKNVETIKISRGPASIEGDVVGREAVKGTGEIISNLSSTNSQAPGRGNGTTAIAANNINGYQVEGVSGKTGKRKIMGSVLGGATYTELTKNEGLTREEVMAEVQKHQAQFQQCYERSLMTNPDLAGRADFEWQIEPGGNVTSVQVKQTTLTGAEHLLNCVKGVFSKMKFPAAKNHESTTPTIGLPFGRL